MLTYIFSMGVSDESQRLGAIRVARQQVTSAQRTFVTSATRQGKAPSKIDPLIQCF